MSMAGAFAHAIDTRYAVHGELATYVPRDAASLQVMVIDDEEEAAPLGFDSGARQTDIRLRVRLSEIANPARGDTLTLADGSCIEVREKERVNRWEWRLITR